MSALYQKHLGTLDKALDACAKRYSWTAYPESPSSKIWGAEPPLAGRKNFEAMLRRDYPLEQPGETGRTGAEISPYTGQPLEISYPRTDVDALYKAIAVGMPAWREAGGPTEKKTKK